MKINKKNFYNSNHGVTGIIVTLMIIGLFVSVLAMIQTVFVPKWMEQKESEHMNEVANQFTQLKFAIDTQALVGEKDIPVSTPVTLGSDEMPFLTTMRSYGDLHILPNHCKLTLLYKSPDEPEVVNSITFNLGSIIYSSSNAYYIDQKYIYENGALILSQEGEDIMSIQPSLSVVLNKDLSFCIFKISELGDKTSAGGYGSYPIQTRFKDSNVYSFKDILSIEIETSYQNAWSSFFNDILTPSSLDIDYSFDVDVTIDQDQDKVTVVFDNILPDLDLKVIDIAAQISPGWVE